MFFIILNSVIIEKKNRCSVDQKPLTRHTDLLHHHSTKNEVFHSGFLQ